VVEIEWIRMKLMRIMTNANSEEQAKQVRGEQDNIGRDGKSFRFFGSRNTMRLSSTVGLIETSASFPGLCNGPLLAGASIPFARASRAICIA